MHVTYEDVHLVWDKGRALSMRQTEFKTLCTKFTKCALSMRQVYSIIPLERG